jgi:hypothetical protein
MKINSKSATVAASEQVVFEFLKDCRNLVHLLPQDNISDWKATEEQCSFKVQKMATIPLEIESLEEFSQIKMKSGPEAPFPFHLSVHLKPHDLGCEGYIAFDGEVNAFLKLMVEKPLTNLFDYMSHKLQTHFQAS